MFLFLSKVLPLLLYPLGLACVLMLVALVTMRRRPRLATRAIVLALLVLLAGGNGWVANWFVRSLEGRAVPSAPLPNADAIVVLGGCLRSGFAPRPAPDFTEAGDRVLYAAQLYQEGKAPLVIVSGGRVDWRGSGPPESGDMAKILERLGVPVSAIVEEPKALNTYENAVNVKKIMDERGIQRVLLVTSAMHMLRSRLIFKRQKIDAIPAPTDFLVTEPDMAELQSSSKATLINFVPDVDRLQKLTRSLKEYLGIVIYRLRGWL